MAAYRNGDEQAFQALYERYAGRVYGFLRRKLKSRSVADDVFQATFLKLHKARARYDAALPFAPWLFTVCRSTLIDTLRQEARIREDLNPAAVEGATAEETPRTSPLPELASLNPERRQALELRYGQDLSFEEIAVRLNTSPANIRQLVSRAVRQLRKLTGVGGKEI